MCGASNTGKSSLLNKVFTTKTFRVGKDPGTTQSLNSFEIVKNNAYILDSPGYSYIRRKSLRGRRMHNLFKKYLFESSRLCKIFWTIP